MSWVYNQLPCSSTKPLKVIKFKTTMRPVKVDVPPVAYVEVGITFMTTISLSILFLVHAHRTQRKLKQDKEFKCKMQTLLSWSFLLLFICILFGIYGIGNGIYSYILELNTLLFCRMTVYFITIFYALFKLSQWISLALRLKETL